MWFQLELQNNSCSRGLIYLTGNKSENKGRFGDKRYNWMPGVLFVRRLHDRDRSHSWWGVCSFKPQVNNIASKITKHSIYYSWRIFIVASRPIESPACRGRHCDRLREVEQSGWVGWMEPMGKRKVRGWVEVEQIGGVEWLRRSQKTFKQTTIFYIVLFIINLTLFASC